MSIQDLHLSTVKSRIWAAWTSNHMSLQPIKTPCHYRGSRSRKHPHEVIFTLAAEQRLSAREPSIIFCLASLPLSKPVDSGLPAMAEFLRCSGRHLVTEPNCSAEGWWWGGQACRASVLRQTREERSSRPSSPGGSLASRQHIGNRRRHFDPQGLQSSLQQRSKHEAQVLRWRFGGAILAEYTLQNVGVNHDHVLMRAAVRGEITMRSIHRLPLLDLKWQAADCLPNALAVFRHCARSLLYLHRPRILCPQPECFSFGLRQFCCEVCRCSSSWMQSSHLHRFY